MSLPQHRWRSIGEPAHDEERQALDKINELLTDDPLCVAWTNLSIPDSRDLPTEIDLLLLNGAGLFVVELKGWHGQIEGVGYEWKCCTGNRASTARRSPLLSTQNKARKLKSLLMELRSEQREKVKLPYVMPIVVMHGRNSNVRLDDRAKPNVYGLDTYDVHGVPALSTLLHEPPRDGQGRLDKPAVDAIRRLLVRSGMTPHQAHTTEIAPSIDTDSVVLDAKTATDRTPAHVTNGRSCEPVPAVLPQPLFEDLSDEELLRLGVSVDIIESVRALVDEADLIDVASEAVFDDLDSVLAGESVDDVVSRREELTVIWRRVDAQAEAAASAVAGRSADLTLADDPTAIDAEEAVARLQSVFGDRVSRRPIAKRPKAPARRLLKLPAFAAPGQDGHRSVNGSAPSGVLVPSERLLDIARAEALQGRTAAGQRLLDEIHSFMNLFGARDWTTCELDDLARRLGSHSLLAQRLETLVDGIPAGIPPAPVIDAGSPVPTGTLWTSGEIGPAYSLLLRVPDVLDRANGVYLSQIIGVEAAADVNARLLRGRPDGGRVRITPSGVVVSRRDTESPWFVVGFVEAEEWFPAEFIAVA